jgi:hypothetical protein
VHPLGASAQILERIAFGPGEVTLDDAAIDTVDRLATALVGAPSIALVAVQSIAAPGETDALAHARALAVVELLVVRGVTRERLVAETLPRDPELAPPADHGEVRFDVRRLVDCVVSQSL